MQRLMLKSKLHRAVVTDADLDYEGSISIDENLLKAARIIPYEKVDVYNVTNGERFSTYAIADRKNSGTVCLNGAAARKASRGDLVIIASYVVLEDDEAAGWEPTCVLVDAQNRIKPQAPQGGGCALVRRAGKSTGRGAAASTGRAAC